MSRELEAHKKRKGQGRECFICAEMGLSKKNRREQDSRNHEVHPVASNQLRQVPQRFINGKYQNSLHSVMSGNFEQTEITFVSIKSRSFHNLTFAQASLLIMRWGSSSLSSSSSS